jgi:putative acetyltransferase
MKFREISRADNATLAEIIRSNLKANKLDIPGTAYFDEHLDHLSDYYLGNREKRYYLIAAEDDEAVGGIGLAEYEFFGKCAELQKLYLSDSVKGKGIGYTLIRMIEEKARELGYNKMYLETHSNLTAAIHIYEKSGYREIEKPAGIVHSTMDRFFIKEL